MTGNRCNDFLDDDLDLLGDEDDIDEPAEVGIDYALSDPAVTARRPGVVEIRNPEPLDKIIRGEIAAIYLIFKDGRKLKVLP